jgi:hypothetical protein
MLFRQIIVFAGYFCLWNVNFGNSLYQFSLPFFDQQGEKVFDIFGKKADFIDNTKFKVSDFWVQMIAQRATITSDQASISVAENCVSGDDSVAIASDDFFATGSDWKFSGDSKNFTFNKDVQVIFKNTLTNSK